MIYKIVRCPHCKKMVMTTSEKIFKCMFCGHIKKMENLNVEYSSMDPTLARNFMKSRKRDIHFEKFDDVWIN
ncbi:MAG: hypothetical protein PHT94_00480 [Candidatus Nanoarchaeia archaeon]|nr:hypothetical protein [Candidatus Nanoarchaeia archaeon]